MKKTISNLAPYKDKKNSPSDNAGQLLGSLVLIIFVSAFLYLLITGIPTIGIVFQLFIDTVMKLLTFQD